MMGDQLNPRRIILFDLYAGGHHAHFVEQLVRHWQENALPGTLELAVVPELVNQSTLIRTSGLKVHPVQDRSGSITSTSDLIQIDRDHGRELRRIIEEQRPDHCAMMYFDHAQLSLATGLRFNYPVGLSGIYFRPSFHYSRFNGTRRSLRETATDIRKKLVLRAALANPHLKYVFSLDPYAADQINGWATRARAIALPDGADIDEPDAEARDTMRDNWGLSKSDVVALMFGAIDSRKGVFQVLEGLHLVPRALQQRISLVLAGRQNPAERDAITDAIRRVRASTDAQIIVEDRFLGNDEIPRAIAAADFVLLPYQHHVGSSNVLIRAAAAGKPVLGPAYGLLGEYIRINFLGITVDTRSAKSIADGLEQLILGPPGEGFDIAAARRFAAEHSEDRFSKVFWTTVLGTPEQSVEN